MNAGAQIITSVFLATSERFAANSGAYVAGAAVAVTAQVTIAYSLLKELRDQRASTRRTRSSRGILVALLVGAAAHVFVTRKQNEPPKWMSGLHSAVSAHRHGVSRTTRGLRTSVTS
jgi:hypothetical protein